MMPDAGAVNNECFYERTNIPAVLITHQVSYV